MHNKQLKQGDRVVVFDNPRGNRNAKKHLGLEGKVVKILGDNFAWTCQVQLDKTKEILNFDPSELFKLKDVLTMYRKERPKCRKCIERVLKEDPRMTLEQIASGCFMTSGEFRAGMEKGIKIQAKKMITQKRGHLNE